MGQSSVLYFWCVAREILSESENLIYHTRHGILWLFPKRRTPSNSSTNVSQVDACFCVPMAMRPSYIRYKVTYITSLRSQLFIIKKKKKNTIFTRRLRSFFLLLLNAIGCLCCNTKVRKYYYIFVSTVGRDSSLSYIYLSSQVHHTAIPYRDFDVPSYCFKQQQSYSVNIILGTASHLSVLQYVSR